MKNRLIKEVYVYSSGNKEVLHINNNGTFFGLRQDFWSNGNKYREGQYFYDAWIGIWKMYYESESIKITSCYKNDLTNGIRVEFI